MDGKLVAAILQNYGIAHRKILEPQKGYRNVSYPIIGVDSQMINLIFYKSEPGILAKIQNANAVSNFLAEKGFPTRHTISPRLVQLKAGIRVKYGALYNYLPGETIPWEAYTRDRVKQLGKMMSDMHAALRNFDASALPRAAEEYRALDERMRLYFARDDVQEAMRKKIGMMVLRDNFSKIFTICSRLPNQQALHMDFVRGNILFKDKDIAGVLDFEKTAFGHPVFDIARTVAFLMVDCQFPDDTDDSKAMKYFIHSGYNKRGKASFKNYKLGRSNVLDELVSFFLLYDFYKFLLHNPYEFLPQNHHFVRTHDILLKRGIIG